MARFGLLNMEILLGKFWFLFLFESLLVQNKTPTRPMLHMRYLRLSRKHKVSDKTGSQTDCRI